MPSLAARHPLLRLPVASSTSRGEPGVKLKERDQTSIPHGQEGHRGQSTALEGKWVRVVGVPSLLLGCARGSFGVPQRHVQSAKTSRLEITGESTTGLFGHAARPRPPKPCLRPIQQSHSRRGPVTGSRRPVAVFTAVNRLSHSCHRRKIKCEGYIRGEKPCRSCESAALQCTFEAPVLKKGPKGARAGVINSIKAEQEARTRHGHIPSFERSVAGPLIRTEVRADGLLGNNFIQGCLQSYEEKLHTSMPFLHPQSAGSLTHAASTSTDCYCACAAMAALVVLCGLGPPQHANVELLSLARALLTETVRLRGHEYPARVNRHVILTSYLCFQIYQLFGEQDLAWTYLREATTLASIFNMHVEDTYAANLVNEDAEKRALYWLMFSADR